MVSVGATGAALEEVGFGGKIWQPISANCCWYEEHWLQHASDKSWFPWLQQIWAAHCSSLAWELTTVARHDSKAYLIMPFMVLRVLAIFPRVLEARIKEKQGYGSQFQQLFHLILTTVSTSALSLATNEMSNDCPHRNTQHLSMEKEADE